jgi:hypothetical protein
MFQIAIQQQQMVQHSTIRGLQTKIHRILNALLNQQDNRPGNNKDEASR